MQSQKQKADRLTIYGILAMFGIFITFAIIQAEDISIGVRTLTAVILLCAIVGAYALFKRKASAPAVPSTSTQT